MTNDRFIKEFCQDGKREGSCGNLFIEGDTLYSYGHHFPIAKRSEGGLWLLNSSSYSTTTSKHQNIVGRYVGGDVIYIGGCDKRFAYDQIKYNKQAIIEFINKLVRARKPWTKKNHEECIDFLLEQNRLIVDKIIKRQPESLREFVEMNKDVLPDGTYDKLLFAQL